MASASDVIIPKPVASGATDMPNAPQGGDDLPPGYSRAGSTGPDDLPAGYARVGSQSAAPSVPPGVSAATAGAPPISSMPGAPKTQQVGPAQPPSLMGRVLNTAAAQTPTAAEVNNIPGYFGRIIGGVKNNLQDLATTAASGGSNLPEQRQPLVRTDTTLHAAQDVATAGPRALYQNVAKPLYNDFTNPDASKLPANIATGVLLSKMGAGPETPEAETSAALNGRNEIAAGRYSPEGDAFTASMRSNSKYDMPAEANQAKFELQRAYSDLGGNERNFEGRNGPLFTKKVIQHAIDINEATNKTAIDPIRGLPADLSQSPELASQFTKEQIEKGITKGDVDAKRLEINRELASSGKYGAAPSKEYARHLDEIEKARDQASDIVYNGVKEATGLDIRGVKRTEASLIRLADVADSTQKTLSQQEAKYNTTSPLDRVKGSVKRLISIKANPTNAFEAGITSPTTEFNGNMKRAFAGVQSNPGSVMRNGQLVAPIQNKLTLTPPPGQTPPEPNRQASFGPLEPGQFGFNLEPSSGRVPPALANQMGIPGIGPTGADLNVPPQPTLPAPLRGAATPSTEPGLPDNIRRAVSMDPNIRDAEIAQRGQSAAMRKKYPVQPIRPIEDPFAAKAPQEPKPNKTNGSGESAASQEAINRVKSEKIAGTKRVVVDTRSGAERPLIGTDAVDYQPKPYESVEFRGGKRDGEIIDQGQSARKYKRKP